jgi:hypothetical protein
MVLHASLYIFYGHCYLPPFCGCSVRTDIMQLWDRRDRKSRSLKTGVHRALRMNRGKRLSTGLWAHQSWVGQGEGFVQ